MQLVEQHLIRRSGPRYAAIDQAAFASENLYNQATYQIRQSYIHDGTYLPYAEIFHRVKHLDCYQALPRKVSNSIESYTSKASFLDLDEIPTYSLEQPGHHQFSGRRSGRWYRARSVRRIQADINGSYNTLRKVIPTAFELEIEGFAVIPRQLAV